MEYHVSKVIAADFNTIEDLINLYHQNPCDTLEILGRNDTAATIHAKRKVKGVNGYTVTWGVLGQSARVAESKASAPSKFTEYHLCSSDYGLSKSCE